MVFNMNQIFKNPVTGEALKVEERTADGGVALAPLTLRYVCLDALLSTRRDETIGGNEKYARWQLSQKISSSDVVDLTVEELSKLKTLIGDGCAVTVVGQVFDIFEGKTPNS